MSDFFNNGEHHKVFDWDNPMKRPLIVAIIVCSLVLIALLILGGMEFCQLTSRNN
jgi:hypothetical protein